MKISKIIAELTELKKYIGDKDLEACIANDTTSGVNVLYQNDDGCITGTSLEGEKMASQKATMSGQDAIDQIKVKVLRLDFCDGSSDPELVAMADVEATSDNSNSVLNINGLGFRYNGTTRQCSIVEPKTPSGECMNELTRIAVANAVMARYEQIKHSDEMLEKLATATSIDRTEYDKILPAITAHFDIDDMDIGDCLEECRLQLKAAYAYINYLENAQLRVTKVDVAPCSMEDDPSRLADVVAVINDGLVIRGIRLYAASPSTLPMFCKDGMHLAYPELVGNNLYPAAYPIQPASGKNIDSQLLEKVVEKYKAMPDARMLPLSWKDILQVGKKYQVKFRPYGHPHASMLSNIVDNSAICECVMENYQPDVKNPDGKPYVPEKALIVKSTITSDMALRDVPYHAIPECEWDQSIDVAVPYSTEAQPERPVSFIDHTPVESKEPTMEHSVYSRVEADKYMDWQANRIKQLEEALRLERSRFEPNGWSKAFTEMYETSIKSTVDESLAKIETAWVTALDKFCRQMDPSAYDGQ